MGWSYSGKSSSSTISLSLDYYLFEMWISGVYVTEFGIVCCLERGSSVIECRTPNRDSPGLNPPFATASKFWHFRSLH